MAGGGGWHALIARGFEWCCMEVIALRGIAWQWVVRVTVGVHGSVWRYVAVRGGEWMFDGACGAVRCGAWGCGVAVRDVA